MDVPSFTFSVKDIDLKKFVNFERVLYNPTEGSKVHALHEVISQILHQLDSKNLLPMSVIQISELALYGCREWGVELNKRFIREVVTTYIKGTDEFCLVRRSKYQIDVDRR